MGNGRIRVTLLMSTRRSSPATSTPSVNAARTAITIPKSIKAMKIERSVKVVRILRRQIFIQIRGMNFMADRCLPEHPSPGGVFGGLDRPRSDRGSPLQSFCHDHDSAPAAEQGFLRWLYDPDHRSARRKAAALDP